MVLITVVAYILILRYQNSSYENIITRLENKQKPYKKIIVSPGRIDTVYESGMIKQDLPFEGKIIIKNKPIKDTIIFQDTFIVVPVNKTIIKKQYYGLTAKIFTQIGYLYPNNKISPQIGFKVAYWRNFNIGFIVGVRGYGMSVGWHILHQPLEFAIYAMKSWLKDKYSVGIGFKIDVWNLSR